MEVNYNVVKDEYKSIIGKDDFSEESEADHSETSEIEDLKSSKSSTKSKSSKKSKTPVLDNFGKDLTLMAGGSYSELKLTNASKLNLPFSNIKWRFPKFGGMCLTGNAKGNSFNSCPAIKFN